MEFSNKISVVIPVYNDGGYLGRALESVSQQSIVPWEVILVDDGSEQPLEMDSFRGSSLNLKILRKENGGPASARNHGWHHATGEFVAFLDADDVWRREKLELQCERLEVSQKSVCAGPALVRFENGISQRGGIDSCRSAETERSEFLLQILQGRFNSFTSTLMFRAEYLRSIGGFSERLSHLEDHLMLYRAAWDDELVCVSDLLAERFIRRDSFAGRDQAQKDLRPLRNSIRAFFDEARKIGVPPDWRQARYRRLYSVGKKAIVFSRLPQKLSAVTECFVRGPLRPQSYYLIVMMFWTMLLPGSLKRVRRRFLGT